MIQNIQGMDPWLKVGQVLICEDGELRERVIRAAQLMSTALCEADWSDPLRRQGERICRRLHRGGSLRQTVESMDPHSVPQVADELLDLVQAATHTPILEAID